MSSHRETPPKKLSRSGSRLARRLSFSPKSSSKGSDEKDKDTKDKKSGLSRRPAPLGKRVLTKAPSAAGGIERSNSPAPAPMEAPKTIIQRQVPAKPLSQSLPSSPTKVTHQGSGMRGDPKFMWKPLQAFATAIQQFDPQGRYQVRLQLGDKIKIQEQTENWFKGIVIATRKKGIFPKNFVHVTKKLYHHEDDAMKELQVALWEWVGLLKTYFQDRRSNDFCKMEARVIQLIDWYTIIKSPDTDENVKVQLMSRVFEKIEEGKRKMGLDVIVRRPDGTRCTEQNTGIVSLYNQYESLANENPKEKKKKEKDPCSIIFLELKLFACSVGEPTEVFFSIWNRATNAFVSENFYVRLTAQGMPLEENRIGNIKAVFNDIATEDLSNLYLFVKLIRIGKLDKKGKVEYRIPFGGALIALSELSRKETELSLPVYTSNLESNFYNLPDLILKQKDVSPVQKAKGIIVGLTHLYGTIASESSRGNIPKHLGDIKSYDIIEKYGFPEIVYPGTSRNDFFITFESAEMSMDKTIEVEASVRMNNGEFLPDCLRLGISEAMNDSFKTTILYHTGSPKWNECISLLIPPSIYEQCHMFFTVRTCSASSAKEYAIGYLPLNKDDGTVIIDGSKQVQLFRLPKQNDDPIVYLTDPSKLLYRKGDVINLTTLLCSTALTQNSYVRALLKWKSDPTKLPEVLNRFTFGSQFEIIKFMQETFDAMCQILDSNLENVSQLVFDAIVFVIGILVDEKTSRFTNFAPVLDTYVNNHFSSRTAHKTVISCMTKYLENAEKESKNVLSSLKAFTYLLKIIKRSLRLDKGSDYSFSTDTAFKQSIKELFNSFASLMSQTSPGLIGAQAILLKNLPHWLQVLEEVFTQSEIAEFVCQLISADQRKGKESKSKINIGKLEVFSAIIETQIFDEHTARRVLVPLIFEHLNLLMLRSDINEVKACIQVESKILDYMHRDREAAKGLLGHVVALLPALSNAFETIKNEEVSLLGITCLLNVYFIISPAHFGKFIEKMNPIKATKFLSQQCQMMFVWCCGKTYPDNWFSLKMFQMATVKKMLLSISEAIKRSPTSWDEEQRSLWLNFFQAGFAFLDCSVLKLEAFSAAKQALIRENYGDMRLGVCALLKKLWDSLGDKQNLLSNDLVKEFLLVSMIGQRDLRNLGINLYFTALEKEFRTERNFKTIESQTIDAFSASLNPGQGSNMSMNSINFNEFFFQALENKLIRTPDIASEARKFLSDLKELCQHLVALSTLRDGDHEDDRTIATLRLMEYLKQSQRINAYVRYIHNLVDQHTKSKHYKKAGMILLLHCELLSWEPITVESRAPGGKRGETQLELKIRLYEQIIGLFEQGLLYEDAISLVQELSREVKERLCDYQRAASLLEREAKFYRDMLTANRYPCEYFRVAYYGKGFASNLRNKEFIYCGNPLERIGEFTERIQSKFPESELMKTTEKPPLEVIEGPGMMIQLFMVKPFPLDIESSFKSHPNLPTKLREYRISMINVNRFLYKRPFSKDKAVRKENEFKDLWTMDIFYITKKPFPTITDRSEITETTLKEVTPVENAVQTIKSKNVELSKLAEQYKGSSENASPFTMVLSGTIDAAVSGGVENYKKAFLDPEYLRANPKDKHFVDDLCDAFTTQLDVLSECIVVHASICPESMQQLQDHLEEKLKELKESWLGDQQKQATENSNSNADKEPEEDTNNKTIVEEGGWGRAPSTGATRRPVESNTAGARTERRGTIIGRRD